MTDERYDYYQSQQQKAQIAHRTPSTAPKMNSESENHAKDGPCQVIVLPNLPSVGGRVKYAMGAMTANQFSQRCGISATYLNQLCIGKAKTLSAYNANRIAGASSMNVTVGWLLGMQQKAAPEPPAPTKQESQELPDLPDFWARLEWAAKRDGRSLKKISVAADLSESMISMYLTQKITPMESKRKRIADVLNVPVDWLCAGLKSDWEKRKENWKKRIAVEAQQKKEIDEGHLQEPQATATNAPIPQSTGTHLHFEGVYSGDVLSALVSVLKGTYRVNLTIDEVGAET
jgi:transcriptional regulator with XRE-family HTH domain